MWNIVKAQRYQLRRDKMVYGMFFFALVMSGIFFFQLVTDMPGEVNGSTVVAELGSLFLMVSLLFLLVVAANISGNDFLDKTINYEILSGHSRKQVYFGRVLPAVFYGVLGTMVLSLFWPVLVTLTQGWGGLMEAKGVWIRYGLLVFVFFRLICELVFLTFITKNTHITYLIGFSLSYAEMIIIMLLDSENRYLVGVGNCLELINFEEWSTIFLNEQEQIFYNSALNPEMIIGTIVISLVFGILSLILGYVYFKHDDLN
ncbi:MAG: hypothetical protein ACI4A3_02765 [Lachnospiraceae bacterium]